MKLVSKICFLAAVLLLLLLPQLTVSSEAAIISDSCGENLSWELDTETGSMVISGTGSMYDYMEKDPPWYAYQSEIKTLTVEYGVEQISAYAFLECSNLQEATISDSVISIGEGAFGNCTALSYILLPDSLTEIVEYAFYGCSELCHVFYGGTEEQWAAIRIREENSALTEADRHYEAVGGEMSYTAYCSGGFLYCHLCQKAVKYLPFGDRFHSFQNGSCSICGVMEVLNYSIDQDNLCVTITGYAGREASLRIPDYIEGLPVTTIGEGAFSHDTDVTELFLGDQLLRIENGAFYGCSIKYVTLGTSLREIGASAWSNCYNLELVALPDSLVTLGDDAFSECSNLQYVRLGDGLGVLPNWSFSGCSSLAYVVMGEQLTTIEDDAFSYCESLDHILFTGTATQLDQISLGASLADVTVHCEATGEEIVLEESCCYRRGYCNVCDAPCTWVKKEDGHHEFIEGLCRRCGLVDYLSYELYPDEGYARITGLKREVEAVVLPGTIDGLPVTEIDSDAFVNGQFRSIYLPASLERIESGAFQNCTALEQVQIGDLAAWCEINFASKTANPLHCGALLYLDGVPQRELQIPEGVTTIRYSTFAYYAALEGISLPDGLVSIEQEAFWNCSALRWIEIPATLQRIGSEAFYGCPVQEVRIEDLAAWCRIEFEISKSIDAYYTNPLGGGTTLLVNGQLMEDLVIPEGVAEISDYAFHNLETDAVVLPKSLTKIGAHALDLHESPHVFYGGTEAAWEQISVGEGNSILLSATRHSNAARAEIRLHETCCGYSRLCSLCGEVLREEYSHGALEQRDSISPTCTEPGSTGNYHCVDCGQIIHESMELPPTGHSYQGGVCSLCGLREHPFADVPESSYYYGPILWAVQQGITNGTSPTEFSPEAPCTRGQIVTFLWRAFGSPEPKMAFNPFSDVSEELYYYKAVLWAVEQGITTGTGSGSFSPEATCTRGQVATFLWRACGKEAPSGSGKPFSDVPETAYYYLPILWAVEQGITNGTGSGAFSPEDYCTRGQIVTFLYRALGE